MQICRTHDRWLQLCRVCCEVGGGHILPWLFPSASLKTLLWDWNCSTDRKIVDQRVEKRLFGWVVYMAMNRITPEIGYYVDINTITPKIGTLPRQARTHIINVANNWLSQQNVG